MTLVFLTSLLLTHLLLQNYNSCRGNSLKAGINTTDKVEDLAVTRFRQYLRINSAHPNPDYESCIKWLNSQAMELGLDFHRVDFEKPGLFTVWLTWNGTDSKLKSILLNTHMDVVAVDNSKWDKDPFEAYKDENGNIYGRGSVDDKSGTVGILEAVRRLKNEGFIPLRTIHVSIVPDEELGGMNGMKYFVSSPEFVSLNVGLDLEETTTSPDSNELHIAYGEKSPWLFNFTARDVAAHGSTLPEVTAGQKIQIVINRLLDYRTTQVKEMQKPTKTISDVTSLNLVRLGGGIGNNIIPDEFWASFDMRVHLKPGWNFTDVKAMLDDIARDAGPGVSYKFIQQSMEIGTTITNNSNVWWVELQKVCKNMNLKCTPYYLNGASDGRYLRNIGIPVFGFNGITNTTRIAHKDNEHINEKNFLQGIDRYASVIKAMSSVPGDIHP